MSAKIGVALADNEVATMENIPSIAHNTQDEVTLALRRPIRGGLEWPLIYKEWK